jgi:DNA mismatch repair protein MutH
MGRWRQKNVVRMEPVIEYWFWTDCYSNGQKMDRIEALGKIQQLVGADLLAMAPNFQITVLTEQGKPNKGWVGHVIERYLGLPLNSSRAPNGGSWELKTVPLKLNRAGLILPKETMAITMLDPMEVAAKEFEDSHLYLKMQKMLVVAHLYTRAPNLASVLYSVSEFDLDNPQILTQVKADYNLIRQTIKNAGFEALTGKLGVYIQPRTKGTGHGSVSRAFYARKLLIAHILGLKSLF